MPYTFKLTKGKKITPAYHELRKPLRKLLKKIRKLKSRGNRPLQMDFEEMLDALIYFHLEEHESGRHLVQALEEDTFAREVIAPLAGSGFAYWYLMWLLIEINTPIQSLHMTLKNRIAEKKSVTYL